MRKMRRKYLAVMLILALFTGMTVCIPSAAAHAEKDDAQLAAEKLAQMSLKEKISQMIIVDFRYWSDEGEQAAEADKTVLNAENMPLEPVTEINDVHVKLIRDLGLGGICLFAENCKGTEQTLALCAQLQNASAQSKQQIGMFIATDQEGGYVTRLATGTRTIGNMALAAAGKREYAEETGRIIGEELSAMGINVDFGPDLDVNNNTTL